VLAWPEAKPLDEPASAPPVPAVVVVPPVAPAEPVKPPTVTITFTTPARAEVFEGDVLLGSTPLPLTRDLNAVATLTFTAQGYKAVTRRVGFMVSQTIALELEKETPRPVPVRPKPEEALKPVPY
jgi:hypothetical protein